MILIHKFDPVRHEHQLEARDEQKRVMQASGWKPFDEPVSIQTSTGETFYAAAGKLVEAGLPNVFRAQAVEHDTWAVR